MNLLFISEDLLLPQI